MRVGAAAEICYGVIGLAVVMVVMGRLASPRAEQAQTKEQAPAPKPQPRPHGQRVKVDPAAIKVEDGDGVDIRWGDNDTEIVRILGIDTPEVRRARAQSSLRSAVRPRGEGLCTRGVRGRYATSSCSARRRSTRMAGRSRICLSTAATTRCMVIKARYSGETVSHYGDNGLPKEAAEVMAAAKEAGSTPLPFEPPHQYRGTDARSYDALKQSGQYPEQLNDLDRVEDRTCRSSGSKANVFGWFLPTGRFTSKTP